MELFLYDRQVREEGYPLLCGVDEAGRGPLVGPVVAAAVILLEGFQLEGINDSKKLTEKKREALFDVIKENAIAYGIGMADHKEIDEVNILQATFVAMKRAVEQLKTVPDMLLIDGNRKCDFGIPAETVVHGDSLSASIAAASVLAKVTRDDYMLDQALKYPEYGFEIHKGYGTKAHYAALEKNGHCPIHRITFLKKFYGTK
jgi:ribonuclease HII